MQDALTRQIMGNQPKNVAEGIGAMLKGAAVGIGKYRADKSEKAGTDAASTLYNSILGNATAPSAATNPAAMGGNMPKVDSRGNISTTTSGDVYSGFMDTVKGGIANPFGLAAVASTGNAESRFSPGNANRSWSDPSERGAPGTAGGIMSWRGPRLEALYSFAGQKGEKPGAISPQTQAEFFLQEDPNLVAALNNAKSVEEAQQLMNRAWQFAGWNRPGGEAAARMSSANAYLPKFQGQPQSREVASLDPSIGMLDTAAGAVTAMAGGTMPASPFVSPFVDPAMQQGGSLSDEVAAHEQTPEHAARFPGRNAQAPAMEQPREVSALPVPPQSQPLPQGIPSEFQGSQELANARGGIMDALNTGAPATEVQIAQARAAGSQGAAAGGQQAAAQQVSAGGVDPRLYELLSNDFATSEMKAVARSMIQQQLAQQEAVREDQAWRQRQEYEQQAAQSDPLYRLKLQQAQKELEDGKRQPLINAGNGNVYDPNDKTWITPPGASGAAGEFRFSGNSVEAQALNGLMDSKQLTPDQAQQLGAGKTITGPNGEIIFMTPQGVFGTPAQGGDVRPITPNALPRVHPATPAAGQGMPQMPAQAAPQRQPQQQPSALPQGQPVRQGNIPLTEPKTTVDEKQAMTFADRMNRSGALIDQYADAGLSVKDQFIRGNNYIPDFAENWMVGEDFQNFDQARRDFINAQLRRESGAVISPEEFDNANKQYFPQPGDGKDVLEQKRRNRQTVTNGMSRSAGPTYKTPSLDEADPLGIR
ncbi:phage tail tip lysozyme [Ensifer canadensis]